MKRHFLLEEYSFINGQINILLLIDNNFYSNDFIDENHFENYIKNSGKLEFFEDCWEPYKEYHYTKHYIIDYGKWKNECCEKDDMLEFLYYYYETHKLPEVIIE